MGTRIAQEKGPFGGNAPDATISEASHLLLNTFIAADVHALMCTLCLNTLEYRKSRTCRRGSGLIGVRISRVSRVGLMSCLLSCWCYSVEQSIPITMSHLPHRYRSSGTDLKRTYFAAVVTLSYHY